VRSLRADGRGALQEVSGVTDVTADGGRGQASVDGEADVTAPVKAVEDAGYTAHA